MRYLSQGRGRIDFVMSDDASAGGSSRLGLHLTDHDARRIRAAFLRSSAVVRSPSFSAWCVEVLLREVETIERRENGGRRFDGGHAGELPAGRPADR